MWRLTVNTLDPHKFVSHTHADLFGLNVIDFHASGVGFSFIKDDSILVLVLRGQDERVMYQLEKDEVLKLLVFITVPYNQYTLLKNTHGLEVSKNIYNTKIHFISVDKPTYPPILTIENGDLVQLRDYLFSVVETLCQSF